MYLFFCVPYSTCHIVTSSCTCTLDTKLALVSLAGPVLGYIPKLTLNRHDGSNLLSSDSVSSASSHNSPYTSFARWPSHKKAAILGDVTSRMWSRYSEGVLILLRVKEEREEWSVCTGLADSCWIVHPPARNVNWVYTVVRQVTLTLLLMCCCSSNSAVWRGL